MMRATEIRLSADHKTAWAKAYSVYRYCTTDHRDEYIGLVYWGSDERWHVLADGGYREGGFRRRLDAVAHLRMLVA